MGELFTSGGSCCTDSSRVSLTGLQACRHPRLTKFVYRYLANTRITFITFDSNTDVVKVGAQDPTIDDLVGSLNHIGSRGSTYMQGTIPHVISTLRDRKHLSHTLIVISDGALNDSKQTIERANQAIATMGMSEVPINGVLIRLQTGGYGNQGDTQALACVGGFCTEKVQVIDANVGNSREEELGLLTLTQAIVGGLEHTTTAAFAEVRVPDDGREPRKCLRRMPVDDPTNMLRMQSGRTTYVLSAEPVAVLLIDGVETEVMDGGAVLSEEAFVPFLEFIEQQLKMMTITGGQQTNVDRIRDWFSELQSYLDTVEQASMDQSDLSVLARTRAMKRAIRKRNGSIIGRILAMENSDRVARLNAQQKADWLRNVDDSKSGRKLARRAGEVDYTAEAQSAVKALANHPAPADPSDDHVSFYSQSNSTESGVLAAKELVQVVDEITHADVLQVIGGVGVPFEAFVSNYPDAFPLRIKRLYCGQDLGEPDLWIRAVQAGAQADGQNKFECPGQPGSSITGVIALRRSDRAAYELMTSKPVRPLFEMQCSAQIRHTVAVAPHDAIALNGAGALHLIEKLGAKGELTTVEMGTLYALIENIRFLIGRVYSKDSYYEIYEAMRQDDPRPWLSGDMVGNVLKPIVALLRFYRPAGEDPEAKGKEEDAAEAKPPPALPAVLRALYYIECYHAAKRMFRDNENPIDARDKALRTMLGIDLQQHGTALKPLFEDEPEAPAHYDVVVLDALQVPKTIPWPRGYCALNQVLVRGIDRESELKMPEAERYTELLGCDSTLLRAVAAVQALQCANENQRIDTDGRVALLPDPTTLDEGMQYLRGVVRKYYEDDYAHRLRAKKHEEETITMNQQIQAMVEAVDYVTFRELLIKSMIVNRDHRGFPILLERLCEEASTPARLEKLALLMTGRDMDAPEVAVWCNGNFLLNWERVVPVFQNTTSGGQFLVRLRAMRKQYGRHTYVKIFDFSLFEKK